MDFSKTKLYQRTRSCYEKLYSDFKEKKNNERLSNSGSGCGLRRDNGGDSVRARARAREDVCTSESSGKPSEGLRASDGKRDEIDAGSRKIRKEVKGKEELGKVLKRAKNVKGVGLVDESENTDNDGVGLIKCSRGNHSKFRIEEASKSGQVEKKLERGKFLKGGKTVSQNSLIDELKVEDGHDSDDDDMQLSRKSGWNQRKFDVEGVFGSCKINKRFENGFAVSDRVCCGGKRGLGENPKSYKSARTNSDDNDALSYLGDNAESSKNSGRNCVKSEYDHGYRNDEKKSEKGFVNKTTDSNGDCLEVKRRFGDNLDTDTSVSSRGCSPDESDDDEGVTYLGTHLDDNAPSHSSRVESNEVKVGVAELDSIPVDDDDEDDDSQELSSDSQELSSSEEDDDEEDDSDWQDLESTDDEDLISSSSSSTDREDEPGKKNGKGSVFEFGVSKKRCGGGGGYDKLKTIEGGLKKRRTDTDALLGCSKKANEGCQGPSTHLPSHSHPLCKLKKERLLQGGIGRSILVEDYGKLEFSSKDDNDGVAEENVEQIIDEKGTQKAAGKSTCRKHNGFGNKIDVIRILTDTIREEADGDELLKGYLSPLEDSPPEETPVDRLLSYKFRFEDEVDTKPDKLEWEVELEGLFNEMNMGLHLSEIGSSGATVVDCDDADVLVEETDQATRCRQGKHQLITNDQFGIICRCCSYVEMESRDIFPPLVKNGRGGHDRYDIDKTDSLKFSDLQGANCHHDGLPDFKRGKYEKGTVWDLVPGVKETMYPHQREGFEFIWKKIAGGTYIEKLEKRLSNGGSGCIISHAPGTGKSRLTIVFLQAFMRMYPNSRPLIIAPRCMLLTWEEEFKKWGVDVPFHNLNSSDISGQEDTVAASLLKQAGNAKSVRGLRLLKLYSWKKKSSILGITYRLFENLAGEEGRRKLSNPEDKEIKRILLQDPTLLVLDEGHTPRNDQSLVWKALLNVKTKRSIILSGTPFQNNFDELYNTLCLVNPLLSFGISSIRSDEYSKKRGRKKLGQKNNSARGQWDYITSSVRKSQHKLCELRAMIDPFVHVHKGTILQERLPGLRDALVVLKPTKIQQTLLGNMIGVKPSLENDYLMSLVSVHPSLLPKSFSDSEGYRKVLKIYERDHRAGVKTNFLMELIKLSEALNEKVLVFSQYIKPLKFMMKLLKTNFHWVEGREFLYMDGQQEEKLRQSSIKTLNDSESEVKVLLASLKACSEGINLVGASRVVLLDVHWNPSVERQAISRAYRLGQKKMVHVYHLVTGTMEGEKYIRQVEKSHLSELVFSSKTSDSSNPKISSTVIADKILEEMVQHDKLQHLFEKVIYQPKESDLVHNFG